MSTIRSTDSDLLPVGWVKASRAGTVRFVHQETGVYFEAISGRSASHSGVVDRECWTLFCRKSAGEADTEVHMGHATTKEDARRQLSTWMRVFNQLKNEYEWDRTIAVGTVASRLGCGRPHTDNDTHSAWGE